jgi:hypothetical protein
LIDILSRLFRKIVARAMVVTRWLAGTVVSRCIRRHLVSLATVRQQQEIRRFPFLFTPLVLISVLMSTLAMSDELAQDEEDAEDYDLDSMGQRGRPDDDDDDAATLVGVRRGGHDPVADDNVVFEVLNDFSWVPIHLPWVLDRGRGR